MFRTILTRFGTGTQNIRRIATTVDQQEIDRFRRLSSRWWSGPEFAPLRSMNQLRVPFISKEFSVSSSLDGIKLLDIGSGGGFLSEALARLGADVTGIDPIEENVQAANEHSSISFGKEPHKRPKYLVSTIEEFCEIPENLNTFDGVIASEVLEHVDNLSLFLDSLSKCLKPNGYFFVTTINQTPVSFFGAIIAAENILGLAPKGTHQYEKFVPPHALNLVLRDYNLETRRIHGMFYNPLTLQWSWTQNQWMNYALVAQKQPSAALRQQTEVKIVRDISSIRQDFLSLSPTQTRFCLFFLSLQLPRLSFRTLNIWSFSFDLSHPIILDTQEYLFEIRDTEVDNQD